MSVKQCKAEWVRKGLCFSCSFFFSFNRDVFRIDKKNLKVDQTNFLKAKKLTSPRLKRDYDEEFLNLTSLIFMSNEWNFCFMH